MVQQTTTHQIEAENPGASEVAGAMDCYRD